MPDAADPFIHVVTLMKRAMQDPDATIAELADCGRFGHEFVMVYRRPWRRLFRRTYIALCVFCGHRTTQADVERSLLNIAARFKGDDGP